MNFPLSFVPGYVRCSSALCLFWGVSLEKDTIWSHLSSAPFLPHARRGASASMCMCGQHNLVSSCDSDSDLDDSNSPTCVFLLVQFSSQPGGILV